METHNCLQNSKVVDKRQRGTKRNHYNQIRRRRECLTCGNRFTTIEAEIEGVLTEEEQASQKKLLKKVVTHFESAVMKAKTMIEEL